MNINKSHSWQIFTLGISTSVDYRAYIYIYIYMYTFDQIFLEVLRTQRSRARCRSDQHDRDVYTRVCFFPNKLLLSFDYALRSLKLQPASQTGTKEPWEE